MGEFDLIARYFQRAGHRANQTVVGIGDDCAIVAPKANMQWAISSDMLVQDKHFFADVNPITLGHKALAVNLSDLAACGARPVGFTLALALPSADATWLAGFSQGLLALADAHGCELIGGDTTQGPLNICITVFGEVPRGAALLRSGAQVGDDVYVSGTLGDACLALRALQGRITLPPDVLAATRLRLESPTPRVALGMALRGIATSAIDISDGMLGDLQHVLTASGVGAVIEAPTAANLIANKPINKSDNGQFEANFLTQHDSLYVAPPMSYGIPHAWALPYTLAGGDDYELIFTAAPENRDAVAQAAMSSHTAVTRVGHIEATRGIRLVDGLGHAVQGNFASFDHFAPLKEPEHHHRDDGAGMA